MLRFELAFDVITIWLQHLIFLCIRYFTILEGRYNFFPPEIINNHLYGHFWLVISTSLWKVTKKLFDHRFWIFVNSWVFEIILCKVFLRNTGLERLWKILTGFSGRIWKSNRAYSFLFFQLWGPLGPILICSRYRRLLLNNLSNIA
jgi:hypothetical protein